MLDTMKIMAKTDDFQIQHVLTGVELTKAKGKIVGTKNYIVKRDLELLIKSANDVWNKMDNEMIECRRRGRFTARYSELKIRLLDLLKIVDKEVFWQQLH